MILYVRMKIKPYTTYALFSEKKLSKLKCNKKITIVTFIQFYFTDFKAKNCFKNHILKKYLYFSNILSYTNVGVQRFMLIHRTKYIIGIYFL